MESNPVRPTAAFSPRCASCGSNMVFDPGRQALCCTHCGKSLAIEAAPPGAIPITGEKDLLSFSGEKTGWGLPLGSLACANCGAVTLHADLAAPARCPVCGDEKGLSAPAKDLPAPTGVCPFHITREDAANALMHAFKKHPFCPSKFKKLAASAALSGLYLPGWVFTASTVTKYRGQYGVDRAEKDRYGKVRTVTDWYPASGTFVEDYNDRLTWGTAHFDEKLLDGVKPFQTADCRAYAPDYLPGFAVEPYETALDLAWKKARKELEDELKRDARAKLIDDKGAHHIKDLEFDTAYSELSYQYLLLPVWVATLRFGGKTHTLLVNGETGKVSGKAPVSPLRAGLAGLLAAAVLLGLLLWTRLG